MQTIFLAHIFSAVNSTSSFPVVGTPASALIFALLFTAAILLCYLAVELLPRPRKNRITPKTEPNFVKAVIVLVSLTMMAVAWDIWWHRGVGRDSFWVAPHVFIYSLATSAMFLSFYAWIHCRDYLWKHIAFALLFIPISGAFDNFFHVIWGVENFSQPQYLSWSPAHALLIIAVIVTLGLLLKILLKFRRTPDFNFFVSLCLGGISSLLLSLAMPFHPTEGWGQVAGFAGAGVVASTFIAVALAAQKIMKGRIDAVFMTLFLIIFALTAYGKETAPQIVLMPHDRPPIWLYIFAYLGTAILLDLSKNRFTVWFRGFLAGILWSAILFGFASEFFAPQFQYGLTEISIAITFSALCGLVVASCFSIVHLFDDDHIEKLLKKW